MGRVPKNTEVERWFKTKTPPSEAAMRRVRDIILGADTRMTEKHYAHLAPSYVADTVRAALPGLGIIDGMNVIALQPKAVG